MIGDIYLIKNKVNDKIYIGKTIQGIEHRFREHIKRAYELDYCTYEYKYNTKFYRAIRKYGKDSFIIESLGRFDAEDLNNKEIYFIQKFDTFNNGYNSTLGGDGNNLINIDDANIELIKNEYNSGVTTRDIANKIGISTKTVLRILKANGVDVRTINKEPVRVVMYDKQFNPLHIFDSKKEIVDWLANNTDYAINLHSIYGLITKACQKGNTAYGFRWQLFIDLQCDNKVFRTKFDKEAYLNGAKAYKIDDKNYYIVDSALDDIIKINKGKKCRVCGELTDNNNSICNKCKISMDLDRCIDKAIKSMDYSKKRVRISDKTERCIICNKEIVGRSLNMLCNSCANVAAKGKSPKPSKEELKSLLDRNMQTKQIAEIYGRSPSTVSTWIKQYRLR